jgi:hypothetical protein
VVGGIGLPANHCEKYLLGVDYGVTLNGNKIIMYFTLSTNIQATSAQMQTKSVICIMILLMAKFEGCNGTATTRTILLGSMYLSFSPRDEGQWYRTGSSSWRLVACFCNSAE